MKLKPRCHQIDHGCEVSDCLESSGLPFHRLNDSIERLRCAIGYRRLQVRDDTVPVFPDRSCRLLHLRNFGSPYPSTPPPQVFLRHFRLWLPHDLPQRIQMIERLSSLQLPGAYPPTHHSLRLTQLLFSLQHCPAYAFEFLRELASLSAPNLVQCLADQLDHVKIVKHQQGFSKLF